MKRLLWAITLILITGAAHAQQPLYSAKFVCGKTDLTNAKTFNFAPGSYYTAINVHNPSMELKAGIRKRFSVALPGEKPGKVSDFFSMTLLPANTMQIDCANIWGHLGMSSGTFIEGVVEIRSTIEVDVIGVYTAAGTQGVATMHMERVPKR
jgi:hypothetical protein